MIKNKKGASVSEIILGIMALFIIIVLGISTYGVVNGGDTFASSLSSAIDTTSGGFMSILAPVFNVLLGLDGASGDNAFLMVLAFILISIIVVGTLDSISIFGAEGKGQMTNLAVGIIVSIIGVRFMPSDLWGSLTAPSSAFVATILMGAPFIALLFVTLKMQSGLARKALWLFFVIFMSYLIFFPENSTSGTTDFAWIYVVFIIAAVIMMFMDASVRSFFYKERVAANVSTAIHKENLLAIKNSRDEIKRWHKVTADSSASVDERKEALTEIRRLKAIISTLANESS